MHLTVDTSVELTNIITGISKEVLLREKLS